MTSRLQYISQGESPQAHIDNIKRVLDGGGDWVQLRLKETPFNICLEAAHVVRELCDQYAATFIMNDHVDIAISANADGVHVGNEDTPPNRVREKVGDRIIGGTANTVEDCFRQLKAGVDYLGLGPFRMTHTKKNLSPILGLGGYKEIMSALGDEGITIPVIAIGGILLSDIKDILGTGIYGVAVSGLLTNSQDIGKDIKKIKALHV